MKTRLFKVLSISIAIILILISCSPKVEPVIVSKDPTTWVETTFAEPETLDPAYSYEAAGGEILQNTLDNLLFFNKDSDVDLVPMLATEVPTMENGGISEDGLTYTFNIREGVVFHDGTALTVEDIAYTFWRNILAGGTGSPQWMMVEPIYGAGLIDISEIVAGAALEIELDDVQSLLENADSALYDDRAAIAETYDEEILQAVCEDLKTRIVADEATRTVTFQLAQPWAPFLNTLAGGGWGGIQSKTWVIENGGWDGDCANWVDYYAWTADEYNATSLEKSIMGTGPYKFSSWTEGEQIVLTANENYWMEQPLWEGAPYGPPSINKVIIKLVGDFDERLKMARVGDADNIIVNSAGDRAVIEDYVGEEISYIDLQADLPTTIYDANKPFRKVLNVPGLNSRTDIGFQFQINMADDNRLVGSGKIDGNGIPYDFFQDVHIRRAFSFCFNYDQYLEEVLGGEGTRAPVLMLPGMAGFDEDAPHYEYDIQKCQAELAASSWTTCSDVEEIADNADRAVTSFVEGESEETLEELQVAAYEARSIADACESISVSDIGFRFSVVYDTGNIERQLIAEILQSGLHEAGSQYVVDVVGLPWDVYQQTIAERKAPAFAIDWLSDYSDTHNWLSAFTCSYYPFIQNFPEEDRKQFCEIGTEGVQITDAEERDAFYKEIFNQKYFEYAPSILLYNEKLHAYQPRYIKGWYANASYYNKWYYALSKN